MDRLAKAARDLRAEALHYFTLRGLLPTEGIVRAAMALDAALPPAPGGGEVGPVAWQMVDKTYGPTAYLGVTEEAAWDRMEAATGFPRAKWEADRHVRPLYAHPTPAPLGGAEGGLERAIREAYSVGYSAGCNGSPNSVRVSDLEALLAAHRAARTA